jgi:hypothetical protein
MLNYIDLLKQLIFYHTSQNSQDSRELKDAINQLIYVLFEHLRGRDLSEEEWLLKIFTEGELFCWTQDKLEYLQSINKKETVYLCCSLQPDGYNAISLVFGQRPYRYLYKIKIKENHYGILLNSFGANSSAHPNEKECLIKMSDIESWQLIDKK